MDCGCNRKEQLQYSEVSRCVTRKKRCELSLQPKQRGSCTRESATIHSSDRTCCHRLANHGVCWKIHTASAKKFHHWWQTLTNDGLSKARQRGNEDVQDVLTRRSLFWIHEIDLKSLGSVIKRSVEQSLLASIFVWCQLSEVRMSLRNAT